MTLEAGGSEVYYAAPAFHMQSELNDAYVNRAVVGRSVFFRPGDIGPLPDDWKHHIAFDPAQDPLYGHLFSEPKKVHILKPGGLAERLARRIREEGETRLQQDYLVPLRDTMIKVLGEQAIFTLYALEEFPGFHSIPPDFQWRENLRSLRTVAYLARTFLDCQLIVMQRKETK